MRIVIAAFAAISALFAAQQASAAAYSFTSTASFTCGAGSNCTVTPSGQGMQWGDSYITGNPATTGFGGPSSPQTGNTPAVHDQIGELVWYNARDSDSSMTVTGQYKLTLNFTQPSPGGSAFDLFTLKVTNTTNNAARVCYLFFTCYDGDVSDTTGVSGSPSFSVNGLTISNIVFSAIGGSFSGGTWTNAEGATSTLQIFADISQASAVPEPASLALIGTAMLGLGLVRRRSTKA